MDDDGLPLGTIASPTCNDGHGASSVECLEPGIWNKPFAKCIAGKAKICFNSLDHFYVIILITVKIKDFPCNCCSNMSTSKLVEWPSKFQHKKSDWRVCGWDQGHLLM